MRVTPCGAWLTIAIMTWAATAEAQGQAALNPDISFIPEFRLKAADATSDDLEFTFQELEIGAQGYLNPFAKADLFVALHDGEIELEEAYVTFTSLPGGLGLRAGQYRVPAGRFNVQHPHQFAFLDFPLFVQEFFGPEGYADIGARVTTLLDVAGTPLTLGAEVLNGRFEEHEHDHGEGEAAADTGAVEPEEEPAPRTLGDLAYNGRLTTFFTLNDATVFELGATAGTAIVDGDHRLRGVWYGGDGKLRWRPDRERSFVLEAEVMVRPTDMEQGGRSTPVGAFADASLQFRRNWNVGALVDYVQLVEDASLEQVGYGAFAGYALFEESTVLRLLVRRDYLPGDAGSTTGVQLQLVFALGPHKPHTF